MPSKQFTDNFDWILLGAVLLLCAVGVVNLYSATRLSRPDLYLTQMMWLGLGIGNSLLTQPLSVSIYLHYRQQSGTSQEVDPVFLKKMPATFTPTWDPESGGLTTAPGRTRD